MKTMIRVIALALVCVLALSLVGCKKDTKKSDAKADDFDWSKYPSKFEDWKIGDLQTYLTARGVLGNEDFMLVEMSAELEQMKAEAGFIYVDTTNFTVNDTVIGFDPNNADGAAMLETVRKENAIVVGEASVPMDAMIGCFTVSYSNSLNEEHISAMINALKALGEHFSVTPDFIKE